MSVDVIEDVIAIVVEDGAVDVSATVVDDLVCPFRRPRPVDVFDNGGAHVHGAVFDHDHVFDHVCVDELERLFS